MEALWSVGWERYDANKAYEICNLEKANNLHTIAVAIYSNEYSYVYRTNTLLQLRNLKCKLTSMISVLMVAYVYSNLMIVITSVLFVVYQAILLKVVWQSARW